MLGKFVNMVNSFLEFQFKVARWMMASNKRHKVLLNEVETLKERVNMLLAGGVRPLELANEEIKAISSISEIENFDKKLNDNEEFYTSVVSKILCTNIFWRRGQPF